MQVDEYAKHELNLFELTLSKRFAKFSWKVKQK